MLPPTIDTLLARYIRGKFDIASSNGRRMAVKTEDVDTGHAPSYSQWFFRESGWSSVISHLSYHRSLLPTITPTNDISYQRYPLPTMPLLHTAHYLDRCHHSTIALLIDQYDATRHTQNHLLHEGSNLDMDEIFHVNLLLRSFFPGRYRYYVRLAFQNGTLYN